MKKFISMVMAAAMVASLAPATAFAANGTRKGEVTATAKVVDADILTKDEAAKPLVNDPYPEIQLKITGVDYSKSDDSTYTTFKQTVEVALDKAHWTERPVMGIRLDDAAGTNGGNFEEDAGTYGQYVVRAASAVAAPAQKPTLADLTAAEAALVAAAEAWWDNASSLSLNMTRLEAPKDRPLSAEEVEAEFKKNVDNVAGKDINFAPVASSKVHDLNSAKTAQATAQRAYDAEVAKLSLGAGAVKAAYDDAKAEVDRLNDLVIDAEQALRTVTNAAPTKSTLETMLDSIPTQVAAVYALSGADDSAKVAKADATGTGSYLTTFWDELVSAGKLTNDGNNTRGTLKTIIDGAEADVKAKIRAKDAAIAEAEQDVEDAKAEQAKDLPAAQAAFEQAKAAYDKAVADGIADGSLASEDLTTAKTNLAAAVTATEAAQKAYDNAKRSYQEAYEKLVALRKADSGNTGVAADDGEILMTIECVEWNQTSKRDDAKSWAKFEILGKLHKDDVLFVDMKALLNRTGEGTKATVSVDSDMCVADDLVFATVSGQALQLSTRKLASVAEDEAVLLDDSGLKVVSAVGGFGDEIELKLSKGFEFVASQLYYDREHDKTIGVKEIDGNKMVIAVPAEFQAAAADGQNAIGDAYVDPKDKNEFTIYGIKIEATSAKSGATATITAKSKGFDSAACEVAKVVDYKVDLTVDEDEDVPVIYSGVNVDNYGITDDSDHWSVEVTAEETFPGAWSFRKGFNFELPEGVHVTDVDIVETDALLKSYDTAKGTATAVTDDDVMGAFFDAYQDGSHMNFEFDKRVFDDVDATLSKDTAMMTFKLQLVADPTFEGDVVLKLSGELVDDQEVTIAKFVKPYTVKAEQNDIIIDYRYTDIPTAITITEAEKGLWAKNEATFKFYMERGDKNFMDFEDDPTFEIDSKSGMEIKDEGVNGPDDNQIWFTVKTESDEAATINIKDIKLFMNRSIPAGPYDLSIGSTLEEKFLDQQLFAPDCVKHTVSTDTAPGGSDVISTHKYAHAGGAADVNTPQDIAHNCAWKAEDNDCVVDSIDDYSSTVKEAFINVVTAGRDVDDASFTTKVVVPVGENYIVAGEKQIELDTPAYINEAGYTMLPIRAVATALGINNSNVLWDQPTKTVTILYGQRIITMSQGQKVVYVNGSAIPASAAVENTNSRTFLPMRDLATALGVTDITWDQATRTATLNGNQK